MHRFWRILLPAVGLLLFGSVSWLSFNVNREVHRRFSNRFFMWSIIRLDTNPLNQRNRDVGTCKDGDENCVSWDLKNLWVTPGFLDGLFLLSALPAFVLGRAVVGLIGTLGVNELTSFMLLMPVLIFAWYYFLGWLLDRRIQRRSGVSQLPCNEETVHVSTGRNLSGRTCRDYGIDADDPSSAQE